MKRRSFLQYVLGVFGIGVAGLPKTTEPDVIITNGQVKTEPIQKWMMPEYMDFAPDLIVGLEKIEGRLLVFCEHSIWEIERDVYDEMWQRKLLSCKGVKDRDCIGNVINFDKS